MSRSRTAFLSGTITDNPLAAGGTTINSAGLASLPAIASPVIAVLVLDPTGSAGAPEVVYVTAHTGAATSATISRAAEGSTARAHASGISWVHGPTLNDFKGWRIEGGDSAEYTMASTTATDLVVISGLLIPVTQPIHILFSCRKTAGAAAAAAVGLKINSTTVIDAAVGIGGLINFSAANQLESSYVSLFIGPRSANYLTQMAGVATIYSTNIIVTQNAFLTTPPMAVADWPNATITSISIRADSGSASVTVGVKDVQVLVLEV